MPRRNEATERAELCRRLRCWREMVEASTRGLRGDPRTYQALYGELLQRCRLLAGATEGDQKVVYENLETLIQPWMNAEALAQASRDIIVEVLWRCGKIERDLGMRSWTGARRRWVRPILLGLASMTALGALVWTIVRLWSPGMNTAKAWRFEISMALNRLEATERGILAGAIAVVAAMFLLSRTAKS